MVDQDVNVTDLLRKVLDVGWVTQVGGDKPSLTASRLNLFDDRCAALCVAADDDDLHAITGKAQGDFFAEPGGSARDESGQVLVIERGHGLLPASQNKASSM